jgi:hypothetical protein
MSNTASIADKRTEIIAGCSKGVWGDVFVDRSEHLCSHGIAAQEPRIITIFGSDCSIVATVVAELPPVFAERQQLWGLLAVIAA